MEREFISIAGLKKVLAPKELKNVLGGTGGVGSGGCCYYVCAYPWFEGMADMTQDECWDMMEKDCMCSFTIQPC